MKKSIVVNLIVFLLCLVHLVTIFLFDVKDAQMILVVQYILIIGITLFSIYINNKFDTEEEEFIHLFNVGIILKVILYIFIILISLIVIYCMDVKISMADIFGISIFNISDVTNENVTGFMIGYYNTFHHHFHRTVGGQISMGQTYLWLLIAYELFIKSRIQKLNKQDIFYKLDYK